MTTYLFYGIASILLLASWLKDKNRTKKALKIALRSFNKLLPSMIPIMIGLGLLLAVLSPDTISAILGNKSGIWGVVFGIIIGSVAFMPSFIAFPLGATLLEHGAGYPQIAGFISSLMAVGFVSIGLEIKYFGIKTAVVRNATALVASILFAIIIWGVMA